MLLAYRSASTDSMSVPCYYQLLIFVQLYWPWIHFIWIFVRVVYLLFVCLLRFHSNEECNEECNSSRICMKMAYSCLHPTPPPPPPPPPPPSRPFKVKAPFYLQTCTTGFCMLSQFTAWLKGTWQVVGSMPRGQRSHTGHKTSQHFTGSCLLPSTGTTPDNYLLLMANNNTSDTPKLITCAL